MNKERPFAAVLFLLMLCPLLLQAQANFKPGYVITAAGDSLPGLIDYREWAQAPVSISFKASGTAAAPMEYTPATCRYFAIDGLDAYQRYAGPISMDEVKLDNLNGGASPQVMTDTVFLRVHLTGRHVNLLSYTDRVKTRIFVQEKGSAPQELVYQRSASKKSASAVAIRRIYVGQLLSLANKYSTLTPELKKETELADYKLYALRSIVSKINGEPAHQAAQHGGQSGSMRFFVGASLNRGKLAISGSHRLSDAENNPSYRPRVAFGFDAFVNRNVQKTVLRVELALAAGDYELRKTEKTETSHNELSYKVGQQTASLVPQVLYNVYNRDNFKAYVGAGAVLNYSNYSNNRYTNQHSSTAHGTQSESIVIDDYLKFEPLWAYYTLRTGAVLNKKYEIALSYQPPTDLTRYKAFAVEHSSLAIGLNYLL